MSLLQTHKQYCPYCGECIELVVDTSLDEQSYVEDCSVCCRPIVVQMYCSDGEVSLQLLSEND